MKTDSATVSPPTLSPLVQYSFRAGVILLYFWCMTLPLVGKAGSQTLYASRNFFTVLTLLLVSTAFSLLAAWGHRKVSAGSLRPLWRLRVLFSFQLLFLIFLLTGVFAR
ncbi:MAG: hypothetical protein ACO3N7_00645 [Kiritimatiellia bacterium]